MANIFGCLCVYVNGFKIVCNQCRQKQFGGQPEEKQLIMQKLDEIIYLLARSNCCAFSTGPYDNRNLKIEEEKKETEKK